MPDTTPTKRGRGQLTPNGRAVARFNALKHGIHSARVLITDGPYPESEREFKQLAAQFHAEFAPVGIAEELLVERLLVLYWRLRRIIVAESHLVAHRTQYTQGIEIQTAISIAALHGKTAAETAADPTARAQVERATVAAQLLRPDDIDRVTTYESTLEKAFLSTLRELHDLQRRRQRPTDTPAPAAPARAQVAIRIDRLELHPRLTPATPIENPENENLLSSHEHPIPITDSLPVLPAQLAPSTPENSTKTADQDAKLCNPL